MDDYRIQQEANKTWSVYNGVSFVKGGFAAEFKAQRWFDENRDWLLTGRPILTTGSANCDAILLWCSRNRPDLVDQVKQIIEKGHDSFVLLMTSSFEAGRMFQAEQDSPERYVPMETDYFVQRGERIA